MTSIITDWRVRGSLSDAVHLLTRMEDWPRWWGGAHKSAEVLGDGHFAMRSRGLLPLRWTARITEARLPYRWVVVAEGDLHGRGIWSLRQAGSVVEVEYDWRPAGLSLLSGTSHRWAMAQGRLALAEEMERLSRLQDTAPLADHAAQPTRLRAIQ